MSTLGKRRTFKDLKRKQASKRSFLHDLVVPVDANSSSVQSVGTAKSSGPAKKTVKLDFKFQVADLTEIVQNLRSLDIEHYSSASLVHGSTADDVFTSLVSQFGFKVVCSLAKAIHTVPVKFPCRNEYISNIVNCHGPTGVTAGNIDFLVEVLNGFPDEIKSVNLSQNDQILWDTTAKHDVPHNAFLLPPVEHCIHEGCDRGALYVQYKCCVTLYTMNGPIPAQKATLRCSECNSIYNIDTFSTQKEGTRIYPFPTVWHAASNRVYFSTDVHELMCEAG